MRKGFAGSVGRQADVDDCELAGYRSDHPVRVLFAGELVATMWVGT